MSVDVSSGNYSGIDTLIGLTRLIMHVVINPMAILGATGLNETCIRLLWYFPNYSPLLYLKPHGIGILSLR